MTVCIIPARLNSTRFPQKVLCHLLGKPMLQHVYEAAIASEAFDQVVFAVDHEKTATLVQGFGAPYHMTSVECQSGTDRLVELMNRFEAKVFGNWQGDEPLVSSTMIRDLLQSVGDGADIWTLKTKLSAERATHPHAVKVVTRIDGRALYFSREAIPHGGPYFKHIGLYAYSKKGLYKISQLTPSPLEKSEKLEQLRFLENGLDIIVHETAHDSVGVDEEADVIFAEQWLTQRG
jgi:3-deoxy-manno-octulosonate cytidylyltransferase (CMP-KDO synthetase)